MATRVPPLVLDQHLIGLACPLPYLRISRPWMLAHRRKTSGCPVVFAVNNRMSLATGALLAAGPWPA